MKKKLQEIAVNIFAKYFV